MPPRIARSSVQGSAPAKSSKKPNARNPKKAAKRALDAFAIAQYENPEKVKIRKNRLGEADPAFNRKRGRDGDEDEDDEGDEDEEDGPKRRKRRSGNDSFDEGSDSEGNTWQMGHVEDDDDEDIDSDEAFGESDEERFEGYTFRGSSTMKKGREGKGKREMELGSDVDMEEEDSADDEEEDEDDLGEDAIDLATALDQYEEDEREEKREREKKRKKNSMFGDGDSDDSPSEGEDIGADGADDLTSDDDDDEEDDEERQAQLNDLISSLAAQEESKSKGRSAEVHESAVPDEFGVSRKVDLLSLKPKVADEEKKRAFKLLADDKSSKRNDIARKLDAPLPKRQQDKLNRAAANAKANETLERWTDTIKSNRRAEHLIFPLQHKDQGEAMGERTLIPTTTSAPANDLESTIQSILQESGLSNGKEDEEAIQRWEELQTNKLPIEEVMKRRAQLRMERELLFREEVRAKRIKKIKSKSYRRVHRKEREKLLEKERQGLKDDGVDISEEEREYNDRRRAEERMGAKHRESKWAKGIKATGRAGWDQDALDGVTEMARRNEELRRRVEGKTVRDEDDEGSDVPSAYDSSDDDEDLSDAEALKKSLSKIKQNPFSTDKSKLGQMAFMQKAEASKRAQNDEAEEALRRELAGEESQSEEDENAARAGRRKYGPGGQATAPAIQITRGEFEEHESGDEEAATTRAREEQGDDGHASEGATRNAKAATGGLSNGTRKTQKASAPSTASKETGDVNPFLSVMKKEKKPQKGSDQSSAVQGDSQPSTAKPAKAQLKSKAKAKSQAKPKSSKSAQETTVDEFLQQRVTAADDDGWATIVGGQEDEEDQDMDDADLDLESLYRNQALTSKGFAGDNVAADFAQEKRATIAEEASTETATHLPGWGSWTGDALTPTQKRRNLGALTITKTDGIDAAKRKDRKLDRVIINEKRVKPNVAYMATQLPFPFETKEQYERSLRLPKGREWTSKRAHQESTRPRVVVKQGVVAPMRKPLV
ncbi:similar to small nucleolar ribonucleoprotein complex subunit Utp14 [Plenodomus lingam JN3]|uniref:Similar to small nucleolar ribonucleoprotein complex subunit Utp14 n=1 Tax=Leptosphaeria maculans (strain JN3 / isolate v23.1.3 / race Av1-4-5-6-7-8) TaxID=985895 RepID=E4ZJ92_LEPMJ|nr:similar to small nucleolar ribonucleoprotein complex subunit Utp14 [Plenodomus lingam JN3]CBX91523.1 similar to small nucleolar ribonucleoprotein complex subunit Utp14 [Plenodomus lingam JN3]